MEDAKAEAEVLKKQLSSERLTIQNMETLLATNREKEFQNHLTTHEKDSEIQLLKDKLTLSDNKLYVANPQNCSFYSLFHLLVYNVIQSFMDS